MERDRNVISSAIPTKLGIADLTPSMAMLSDDVIAEARTVETHPLRVRFDRARFSNDYTLR
jgi:hypothetical protein